MPSDWDRGLGVQCLLSGVLGMLKNYERNVSGREGGSREESICRLCRKSNCSKGTPQP